VTNRSLLLFHQLLPAPGLQWLARVDQLSLHASTGIVFVCRRFHLSAVLSVVVYVPGAHIVSSGKLLLERRIAYVSNNDNIIRHTDSDMGLQEKMPRNDVVRNATDTFYLIWYCQIVSVMKAFAVYMHDIGHVRPYYIQGGPKNRTVN